MAEIKDKMIINMSDYEIGEIVVLCSNMFGTKPSEGSITAFIYLLKQKFLHTTSKKIVDACTEYASNPGNNYQKFTPAFLSSIIRGKNTEVVPFEYQPKYVSDAEKREIWLTFREELYQMFDEYVKTKDVDRIAVWAYICGLLRDKGYITQEQHDNAGSKNKRRSSTSSFNQVFSDGHKDLALMAFHQIACEGKHLKDVIQ